MGGDASRLAEPGGPPGLSRPRLLVVDDDPDLLELIQRILAEQFEVVVTCDPRHALELVQSQEFDLHLYDVCMEALPGIELLVLTHAMSAGTPVLLMTGAPTLERAVSALRAGATDLLLKPLRFDTLAASLQETLEKARTTRITGQQLEAVHEALTRAVEAKDPTTSGHGERVRAVCRMIAHQMGLSAADRKVLDRAAALHDVGKIGVPDAVLSKPAALTEQEFRLIRMHPEVGAKILEPLPEMSEVRECVLGHHERWDGKGYPHGLRGEEVSVPGRVLILVEVFDALAHRRSYKEAWPKASIHDHFAGLAGRQFDPELTRGFLHLVEHRFEALVNPLGAAQSA